MILKTCHLQEPFFLNIQIFDIFHLNPENVHQDAKVRDQMWHAFNNGLSHLNFKNRTFLPLCCQVVSSDDKNSHFLCLMLPLQLLCFIAL